jgi:hypothetical protein
MVMNHLAHILRDWDAFLVRLSRVDESSQSGTSFPESGASFEDVIMHHVAHVLREWNVGLESERLQLSRNESLWLSYRRSGRVYIAWPKDVEKLRNDDLRNGLLGLREATIEVVDTTMKERTRDRARR